MASRSRSMFTISWPYWIGPPNWRPSTPTTYPWIMTVRRSINVVGVLKAPGNVHAMADDPLFDFDVLGRPDGPAWYDPKEDRMVRNFDGGQLVLNFTTGAWPRPFTYTIIGPPVRGAP